MDWLKLAPNTVRKIARSGLKAFNLSAVVWLVLAGIVGWTAGCSMLGSAKKDPAQTTAELRLVDEQLQLQRFADDFLARGNQALDQSAELLGTDTGRQQVVRIKLILGSSVVSIVSGPNPRLNLLDLVTVTVLTRLSVEEYWTQTTNGAAFEPWLQTSRVLETNVWDLAARFLEPAQVEEVRAGINDWYRKTPEVRTAFFARPHAFVESVRTTAQKDGSKTSAFSLINLDPNGQLTSAVREVTESRLMAERAMYVAQRMPFLLRLQGEQFAYEVTEQATFRTALTNSIRASESIASVSQTISQLPSRIADERKETLAAFESQQGKLRDLASDIDRALVSGEKMAGSLSITITNAQAFLAAWRAGESNTNAPPFSILDYGQTADKIGAMAQSLNALVLSMNQSEREIQRISRQATDDLNASVDHGFRLGLVLVAVLLIGAVPTALVYRFLLEKLKRRMAEGRN